MNSKQPFKPTQEMIKAAENLFLAMAIEQTIRPVVEAYQRVILNEGQWHINPKYVGQRGTVDRVILDPKESFMMLDEDFAVYDECCMLARDAAKLSVESPDQCPLLVAEHTVCFARGALIDTMEATTGVTRSKLLCGGMNQYHQYIELTLKLLAPFVDSGKILTDAPPVKAFKTKSINPGM